MWRLKGNQPACVCVTQLYPSWLVRVCMNFYASGVVNYLGATPLWKIGNGLKGEKKLRGKKLEEGGLSLKDVVTWSFEGIKEDVKSEIWNITHYLS